MEKFNLLHSVLKDLQEANILKDLVLVGSWCLDFYRFKFGNPIEIPSAKTNDADILIPRRYKTVNPVDISQILKDRDFIVDQHYPSGFMRFIHRDLNFEFLTDAGAKPQEDTVRFKELGIVAQELHFMSIPFRYKMTIDYNGLKVNVPEPEAFALHKLIVSQRRDKSPKKEKDISTAKAMFLYFKDKPQHIKRLYEILDDFSKGWKKKVDQALEKTGLELPK